MFFPPPSTDSAPIPVGPGRALLSMDNKQWTATAATPGTVNPPASPCSPQAEGWIHWLRAPSSQDGRYPQLALSRKIHVTESFLSQPTLAHPGCPAGFASCGWVWEVLGYWGEVCTGSLYQGSLNPPSSPRYRKALETGPDPSNHCLLLLTGRLRLGG